MIAFTPATNGAYDYGTVDVGVTASQTFTLTNSGRSTSGKLSIALTGSTAFHTTADTCTATSLRPRKSCHVTVAYTAAAAGQVDTATLVATGRMRGARTSLILTGASRLHLTFSGEFSLLGEQIGSDPACALLRWRFDASAALAADQSGVDLDPAQLHVDFCLDISITEGTMSLGLPNGVLTGDVAGGFYFPGGGPAPGSNFPQQLGVTFDITAGTGEFAGAGGSVLIGATWPRFQSLPGGSINGTVDIPGA